MNEKNNHISSCIELFKKMRGTMEGNFHYSQAFRIDFENRMSLIDTLKQELQQEKEKNKKLEEKAKEILNIIKTEKNIAMDNILKEDYHLAENGAIAQELGYLEGKLKEFFIDTGDHIPRID